jgi:hypothetical protein
MFRIKCWSQGGWLVSLARRTTKRNGEKRMYADAQTEATNVTVSLYYR